MFWVKMVYQLRNRTGAIWYNGKRLTEALISVGFGRLVRRDERKTKPWVE
tara:strand:- start:5394 stop:5543 length:150 start_codon:yes stop_codon:yes gene_type:complete